MAIALILAFKPLVWRQAISSELLPLALWLVGSSESGLARFVFGLLNGLTPFLLLAWLSSASSPIRPGIPDRRGAVAPRRLVRSWRWVPDCPLTPTWCGRRL